MHNSALSGFGVWLIAYRKILQKRPLEYVCSLE
jgi:hypothetical protein